MSLLAKIQAQKEEGRRQSIAVKDAPRRPSMAVKTLAVPGGSPGARRRSSVGLSGPRTGSISAAPGSQGPSLMGLLASKRFAKKLTSRLFNRRRGSRLSGQGLPLPKEPSYRMEPHRKFHQGKVEEVIKSILDDKLEKFRYSAKICPNMCKILGDDIKEKVKTLNFDRYKIICHVVIGQKKDQGVMTCSRCAWDQNLDDYAAYSFQNEHIFCTATVFGVYTE